VSRDADDGDLTTTLRAALARTADSLPVPDLVERVHSRAHRVRRRRRVVAAGRAAAAVVVVATLAVLRPGWPHTGPTVTVDPAVSGRPSATSTPPRPSPSAANRSQQVSTALSPSSSTGTPPARTDAAKSGYRDDFSAPLAPKGRWSVYGAGGIQDWTSFTAGNTTVHDGLLDLAMTRPGPGQQLISGVGAVGSPRRYGRWEMRWRMTGGTDLSGGLVMVAPGTGGYPLMASLAPDERALVLGDAANQGRVRVPLDPTGYHRLALEWTPDHVRWLVDGRAVATWTDHVPDQPLWPALQTDVGLDCRPMPQPAACDQQKLPQHLLVDWLQYVPSPS